MGTSLSADLTLKYPITGIDDCARTASGQAAAVQPTSPMNSRRLMQLPQGRGFHRTTSALGAVLLHHSRFGPPTLLAAAPAVAWQLAARAQQPDRVRRIGVLMASAADDLESQARIA